MSYTALQQYAIDNYQNHQLMCAGPGSGKTHTVIGLVERIISEVPEAKVSLVTFTNAAAKEMGSRIEKKIGKMASARQCQASTFASLMIRQATANTMTGGANLLRGRKLCIGAQTQIYMNTAFRNLGIREFSEKLQATQLINDSSKLLDRSEISPYANAVIAEYEHALSKANAIDLDGLVRELIVALQAGEIPFHDATHIIVDEFQDTDALQYEWVRLHGMAGATVTAVGDDDQSIYSWRESCGFENMAELMTDFDIQPTILNQCFRCPPEVLQASNALILNNQERVPKQMESMSSVKGQVSYMSITKETIEDGIESLRAKMTSNGLNPDALDERIDKAGEETDSPDLSSIAVTDLVSNNPGEWTVLARSNMTLDDVEAYLTISGFEVIRLGGKSIWDNEYMLVMAQVIGILMLPKNGNLLGSVLSWSGEDSDEISSILDVAQGVSFINCSRLEHGQNWASTTASLHEICRKTQHNEMNFDAAMSSAYNWVLGTAQELRGKIRKQQAEKLTATISSLWRIVVSTFNGVAGNSETKAKKLIEKAQSGKKQALDLSERTNQVVLSTMNSSKGLEFPRVLVHKIESRVSPSKITYTTEHEEPVPPDDDEDEVAAWDHRLCEERRLLYVAMTRAEKQLMLSYRAGKGSGFLREIFGEQDFDVERPEFVGDLAD